MVYLWISDASLPEPTLARRRPGRHRRTHDTRKPVHHARRTLLVRGCLAAYRGAAGHLPHRSRATQRAGLAAA